MSLDSKLRLHNRNLAHFPVSKFTMVECLYDWSLIGQITEHSGNASTMYSHEFVPKLHVMCSSM